MKFYQYFISVIILASMILFAFFPTLAIARIALFIEKNNHSTSSCRDVLGTWQGKGHLKSMFTECIYEGTAKVSGSKTLQLETVFYKTKGPAWCKEKFKLKLTGLCENNIADFEYPDIYLSGKTAGHLVYMEGTIDLSMTTYLELSMHKKI